MADDEVADEDAAVVDENAANGRERAAYGVAVVDGAAVEDNAAVANTVWIGVFDYRLRAWKLS